MGEKGEREGRGVGGRREGEGATKQKIFFSQYRKLGDFCFMFQKHNCVFERKETHRK